MTSFYRVYVAPLKNNRFLADFGNIEAEDNVIVGKPRWRYSCHPGAGRQAVFLQTTQNIYPLSKDPLSIYKQTLGGQELLNLDGIERLDNALKQAGYHGYSSVDNTELILYYRIDPAVRPKEEDVVRSYTDECLVVLDALRQDQGSGAVMALS